MPWGRQRRAMSAASSAWLWLRGWNWPLLVLLGGFALLMPWQPMIAMLFPWLVTESAPPFAPYEQALREAAIKQPTYRVALRTIETPDADLVTFGFAQPQLIDGKLASDVWAALPDELRKACSGAADPVLRLQQILGKPARSGPQSIFPIKARREDVFRPCMSGGDPMTPSCGFEVPTLPDDPKQLAGDGTASDSDRALRLYKRFRFVAGQMWAVYQSGFAARYAAPGDYPFNGYPFTGMGWTYDWSPDSKTHVGVSEFIVPKDAPATLGASISPAAFCAAAPG